MGSVQCLSFSRGSKFLAAGRADGIVHVWDVKQQKCALQLTEHVGTVTSVAFTPDGQILASSCMSGELLLHTTDAIKKAKLHSPSLAPITCLDFACQAVQDPVLACSTDAGLVHVWCLQDMTTGESFPNLHKGAAAAVRFADGFGNLLHQRWSRRQLGPH
ncbi:g2661 [Coccomyxa elongata]